MTIPSPDAGDVERLQVVLAAEHAVIYAYGTLGARLETADRRVALLAFDSHRVRRDQLAARLRERDSEPSVALGAYDVAVPDEAAALALAARLEDDLGVRWRDLLAGTDDAQLRRLGLAGLTETAVRAAGWKARAGVVPVSVALPGTS